MILTITLNPSVDIRYTLDELLIDTTNRVEDFSKTAGGKGLNVARVLRQLDEHVAATGFLGGSLGSFIRGEIQALGIQDEFVDITGETRNCIAVIHEGKQTEILESGPTISKEEAERFIKDYLSCVKHVQLITISGSLPKGLPNHFYVRLLGIADDNSIPVLLDTSGSLLQTILKEGPTPFLIKPNEEEFAEVIGKEVVQPSDIIEALTSSPFKEIPWVVVTLGAKGAIVKKDDTIYKATIPTIQAVNPVGSGDSVIAGFASGLVKNLEDTELITYGLTMGILNALEEKTGSINKERVDEVMRKIEVEKVYDFQ